MKQFFTTLICLCALMPVSKAQTLTIGLRGSRILYAERGRWLAEIDPGIYLIDSNDISRVASVLIDSADYNKNMAGNYMVLYTAIDTAGKRSNILIRQVVLSDAVGGLSDKNVDLRSLKVYPNPSNGVLYIDIPSTAIKKICVFDVLGKMIVHKSYPLTNSIDLTTAESGLYIITLTTTDEKIYSSSVLLH